MTRLNRFQLRLEKAITDKSCLQDLQELNLSKQIASEYLHQAEITDTKSGKKRKGLVFENDAGGFDFRTYDPKTYKVFEGTTEPRGITVFPAHHEAENVVAFAFDHYLDFLVFVQAYGRVRDKAYIIVNGCPQGCIDFVKQTYPVYLLHAHRSDNGIADGLVESATVYGTLEHLYKGHKNLSDMRKAKEAPELGASIKSPMRPTLKP